MEPDERVALERLEAQIRRATEEIRRLRDDNKTLRGKQRAITTSEAKGEAWSEEREEIRRRVERLADGLETLLTD